MKRLFALLLAAVMLLSLAACGAPANNETTPNETIAPETTPATQPSFETVENPVTFFSLSLSENFENTRYISVFDNGDGTINVEFVSDVKKVCTMDASVFNGITTALNESGLVELNGMDAWTEGEATGSMYVELADGTCYTANCGGEIPAEYAAAYAAMEAFFTELTADIPEYVPQPMVQGEVDETLFAEMTAILNAAALANPDAYIISDVAKDEFFAFTLGLSSDEGIARAISCAPMMMTTAYSLNLVTLDGADAESVCADFEASLDWAKWVCVNPSDALIATKDNMVLCLMADGDLYAQTSAGIEASGWTVVNTLTNPNM